MLANGSALLFLHKPLTDLQTIHEISLQFVIICPLYPLYVKPLECIVLSTRKMTKLYVPFTGLQTNKDIFKGFS